MEISIQELIELEDCSEIVVKKRYRATRQALYRYRYGMSKTEEKEILKIAMKSYESLAFGGKEAIRYNALLYYNFASRPLKPGQIAKVLHINKRTVHKLIDLGVKDLTVIIYGVGGLDLLPQERSSVSIKEKIQESITM
ncbi:MAG: hypothetical protein U9N81_13430 [Bacillota bacterium]|nr:hypothetical protein [Bacillota bacterium]